MYSSDLDLAFPKECLYFQAFLEKNKKLYKEDKFVGGKNKAGY